MRRKFVYVDCETTGLNPRADELVEISYAVMDGPIETLYFGVTEVPQFIDELIGFTERKIAGRKSDGYELSKFMDVSRESTMVSANPPFDQGFLIENFLWAFHYRMLDIESFAMAKLNLPFVPGMSDIYNILVEQGHELTKPDHTSHNDVAALREAHQILGGSRLWVPNE